MSVSVETLNGLERKLTVSIPTEKIEEAMANRLKNLAKKVKVDGFRPGKVPLHVVKTRYSESVRIEVARDMIEETLFEAIQEKDLKLAGYPSVDPEEIKPGSDFIYHAVFEILPEFEIKELQQDEIEVTKGKVTEKDVDTMLEKLQEQSKEWIDVSRKSAKGDKVNIDFQGFINGEEFTGGSAEQYDLELGSGSMIPGFEEGLEGTKAGDETEITVTFPEDYGNTDLAGKEAVFKIKINAVKEAKLPELNDAFAEKFNIEEGGLDALKKDIRQNMERELERRISSLNRERLFDALVKTNPIDLPKIMIDKEIENLKHDMYHRIFGHKHHDNEKIPDFPRELFEEQAKKRVHLGLLFAEYVNRHNIEPDDSTVDTMLDKLASAYVDPEEFRSYYKEDEERLGEIKALVTEEMVANKIGEHARLIEKEKSYDEVMNPQPKTEEKGE